MPPTQRLQGIQAKIDWAKQHIGTLEQAIKTFRTSDPYGFKIENDPKSGDKIHIIQIRQQTPANFPLIIGDAIHNLRSALDYLAWQLVLANGQQPKSGRGGTQFPTLNTKGKSGQGDIQGISTRAQTLVDAVQPYQGSDDDLWTLHQLDITDKHKLLIVTAFALNEIMPTWKVSNTGNYLRAVITSLKPVNGVLDFNLEVTDPKAQKFNIFVPVGVQDDGALPIIDDGTAVARLIAPLFPEARFDLSFEITINEPSIVAGKPIVPLLNRLANHVNSIITQFASHL